MPDNEDLARKAKYSMSGKVFLFMVIFVIIVTQFWFLLINETIKRLYGPHPELLVYFLVSLLFTIILLAIIKRILRVPITTFF